MVGTIATALVAHQGGWDEVLLVVGPLVTIVGIVLVAKARIDEGTDQPAG
jgi:uncharacterized membrane protein